ncbi:MerR family DNA-binding transcriptional regulator [Aestuariirhabdus litorea]|uniref:MerR family DNA-binding transcriptional regulator n=1 Tax=Aestuariirhabdus litorea TaxID=2528527 RepID=A0A3P3VQ28_9GAMM|nr:MerR family DNA-binding transcriptional regulator [Aestuariirhabdus litorea]RRJ84437.1 MerR family DNA-binding transcriptional regulator [Aestuariirhabdus litorea]RWW97661.1 MerR family DNA-binding transcriptional regulator [Endozoicomonadaceae bacterium GTF-13]
MPDSAITIGEMSRRFGLSRSALLYYDRIGLLSPSLRSAANYRLYGSGDQRRMASIQRYREAGIALDRIAALLDGDGGEMQALLEQRLQTINREIQALRDQQRLLVSLLQDRSRLQECRTLDKQGWVRLLAAAGMSEADMRRWHVEFERQATEAHEDFLQGLGIETQEIGQIRRWSREATDE